MERLTGCTRGELIGTPFKSHFTDPERAQAAIASALRDMRVTNNQLTARATDGKTTVVSCGAITYYDRDESLEQAGKGGHLPVAVLVALPAATRRALQAGSKATEKRTMYKPAPSSQ